MIVPQQHPLQLARQIGLSKNEFRQLVRMTACHCCLAPLKVPAYQPHFLVTRPDNTFRDSACKLCPDCGQLLDHEHDRLVDDQGYKGAIVLKQVSTNRRVGAI